LGFRIYFSGQSEAVVVSSDDVLLQVVDAVRPQGLRLCRLLRHFPSGEIQIKIFCKNKRFKNPDFPKLKSGPPQIRIRTSTTLDGRVLGEPDFKIQSIESHFVEVRIPICGSSDFYFCKKVVISGCNFRGFYGILR